MSNNNQQGWIKLHRSIVDWGWYSEPKTFQLFLHCLLRANHKERDWQGITVKRGQFVTSIKHLSNETGLTNQNVRTILKRLKSTKELTIETTSKYSIVTVCKYDSYQVLEGEANTPTNKQITINQQTSNNQLTTNKNDNNIKNDNKYFTHDTFIIWFNDCRKYIGLKSNIAKLSRYERDDFNELVKHYTKEDFKKAFKSFSVDDYYKGNNLIFPKYFLKEETFTKYLNTEVKELTLGEKLMGKS